MQTVLLALLASQAADPEGFVLVRGGSGRVRVEEFELCDHPVTNAEYRKFVQATGHPAPVHWEQGRVPAGMESHPVVYVNRYDAEAYCAWRSKAEGRAFRLPTDPEYQLAARGGTEGKLYPWGDEDPSGRCAFDPDGTRLNDQWRSHLRPVKSFAPNAMGLYDMVGNVWQMVSVYPDPARSRFKYRISAPADLEGRIVGGSWARTRSYLALGTGGTASPGIRLPDLGFRVAREPWKGAPNFHAAVRRLVASREGSRVFVGWQLLPQDAPGAGFNVYRNARRDSAGERVNAAPIAESTNFEDPKPPEGLVYYRVRAVLADGREGASSEWAPAETAWGREYVAARRKSGAAPGFGDLDGDGLLDVVLRLDNGCTEMSVDPGVAVELEAYTSYGRFLWRRPQIRHENCFGSANDAPLNVCDLDGDGRAEVIARIEDEGKVVVGVLDGMTGKLLRKTPWPEMLTDFAKSSTRIHLSVAHLDGKRPAIVTQTGLYENEVFVAYDAGLNRLWEFKSVAETNGSGSHHIDVADVDGDGKDEIFDGTTCLNGDGTVRWSIYRQHPDIVAIKDFLPERPGLEVFFAVESNTHAGAYLVEAATGRIIWKVNREDDARWTHAHHGWAADIWGGSPGIECFTNRDGHPGKETVLLSSAGRILTEGLSTEWRPVEWDGDGVRELLSRDGQRIGKFDGKEVVLLGGPPPVSSSLPDARVVMVADLWGDFRDEIVVAARGAAGDLPTVSVHTATTLVRTRKVTRTADHAYRMWLAHNLVGGYGSHFE
jgi:hypothetical protein